MLVRASAPVFVLVFTVFLPFTSDRFLKTAVEYTVVHGPTVQEPPLNNEKTVLVYYLTSGT